MHLCIMFICRKHNRSGTFRVVVVDKSSGKFKETHHLGIAHSEEAAVVSIIVVSADFRKVEPPDFE